MIFSEMPVDSQFRPGCASPTGASPKPRGCGSLLAPSHGPCWAFLSPKQLRPDRACGTLWPSETEKCLRFVKNTSSGGLGHLWSLFPLAVGLALISGPSPVSRPETGNLGEK